MKDIDTTFSEELMVRRTWREWTRENKVFLFVIGILSLTSMALLFYNQWHDPQEAHLFEKQPLSLVEPPPHIISKKPKRNTKKNVISEATFLFEQGKVDEAISLLLRQVQDHSNESVREEAARLSKKWHMIQKEKQKLRQQYLEGYVLFQTYPQKACETWESILGSTEISDIYYQKAKRRWEGQCKH